MVHFVGAGPGAADLMTVRGTELLRRTGTVVYAGSLVNPALADLAAPECERFDSAYLTLEEIVEILRRADRQGREPVRLHSGDPCLYGALREQTDALDALGVPWDVTPGVSSFCAAAAALGAEFTLPGVSQSVILTRLPGRTPVPEGESLARLAECGASMAIFLSTGMAEAVQRELLAGGRYSAHTPAAVVYRASWPDQQVIRCTVGTLAETVEAAGIRNTALLLAGDFLDASGQRSKLYDGTFSTGYREGSP